MDLNLNEAFPIKVMILNSKCEPKMGRTGDAAFDLRAAADVKIPVGGKAIIPLGVAFKMPSDYCGILTHRSSLAFKHDCTISYGLIDSSFDSEVKCCVFNHGYKPVTFLEGTRIAQIRFTKLNFVHLQPYIWKPGGKEGFGSSGGYRNE